MEPSRSALSLDKAIKELDGMYNELTNTVKRRSQVVSQFGASEYDSFEDDDYDVPRPAHGFQNMVSRPNSAMLTPSHPDKLTMINSGDDGNGFYRARSFSPKSPTHSEYSSGIGTLPSQRVIGSPAEIHFPGPPDIEPPPIPEPPSDSDYDEVASVTSDTFIYSVPNKDTNSFDSNDYSEIPETSRLAVKVIDVNTALHADDGIPDYDEVCSEPPSQRDSAVILTETETASSSPGSKIVVKMKQASPTSPQQKEIQQQQTAPETSFINQQLVVKLNEINPSPPQQEEIQQQKVEETSFTNPQIVELKPPAIEIVEIEKDKTANDETSKQGNEEPTNDVTTDGPHPVDSKSSTPKEDSPLAENSKRDSGAMDVEAQKPPRRRKSDCPCECRAAVPLMSVAVVVCIMILMFTVIGFVYVGLQNDDYLDKNIFPPGETSGSGAGV